MTSGDGFQRRGFVGVARFVIYLKPAFFGNKAYTKIVGEMLVLERGSVCACRFVLLWSSIVSLSLSRSYLAEPLFEAREPDLCLCALFLYGFFALVRFARECMVWLVPR